MNRLDAFFDAYLDAIVFTDVNDNPEMVLSLGFSDELLLQCKNDCRAFLEVAGHMIPDNLISQAGHDFWLTRNEHGAGFWDSPEIWDFADELTAICGWRKQFLNFSVYVGDDNLIYGSIG